MEQELIIGILLFVTAFVLLLPAIRLEKTNRSFSIVIKLLIVFLSGTGLFLILAQHYIPESYPVRAFIFLPLSLGWVFFSALVIVKIYKTLNKGWKKALFLVPSLLLISIFTVIIFFLSVLNYHSSDLIHSKVSPDSNPDKTLYIFPNRGEWFSKPGFSFYYRSGKLPVMEYKTGYNTVEIIKIDRKGDSLVCTLRTTRTLFPNHTIRLTFNLETGEYSRK